MTHDQQAHLEGIVARFAAALRVKYAAGQAEHGGNLWEKPGLLAMAKAEVLDQWVYLDTLETQLQMYFPDAADFAMGTVVAPALGVEPSQPASKARPSAGRTPACVESEP